MSDSIKDILLAELEKINVKLKGIEEGIARIEGKSSPGMYDEFIALYNFIFKKKSRGDSKSKRQFPALIKRGWTLEEFEVAMRTAYLDDYHASTTPPHKHLTPEFFTREDKLNKFCNHVTVTVIPPKAPSYDDM